MKYRYYILIIGLSICFTLKVRGTGFSQEKAGTSRGIIGESAANTSEAYEMTGEEIEAAVEQIGNFTETWIASLVAEEEKEIKRQTESQRELETLKNRIEELEAKEEIKVNEQNEETDRKISELTAKYSELEAKYEELLNRTLAEEVSSSSVAEPAEEKEVLADRGSSVEMEVSAQDNKSALNEPAVKEYLDEYYVDVDLDLDKKHPRPEAQTRKLNYKEEIPEKKIKEEQFRKTEERAEKPVEERSKQEKEVKEVRIIEEKIEKRIVEPERKKYEYEEADEIAEYVNKKMEEEGSVEDEDADSADTQKALRELHNAQKLYYTKRYNDALKAVSRSLRYQETAFAYALEGSILFTLGDVDSAVEVWESALSLDPGMYEVREALDKYKR
ncbi:hypothetical protein ACFLUV_04155 [Elusimicrobiota bacterium]